MPRRSILSGAERDSALALPDSDDALIQHYTFNMNKRPLDASELAQCDRQNIF